MRRSVGQTATVAAEKRVSVLNVCTARLGLHRGALAAANVAQLAMTTADLGHWPSATEYADYWAITERTAWYHRSRAREVFGDDLQTVVEQLARDVARKRARSPRAVMQLPAPSAVTA